MHILIIVSENLLDKKLGKVFDPLYGVLSQMFDKPFNFCCLSSRTVTTTNTINNQQKE